MEKIYDAPAAIATDEEFKEATDKGKKLTFSDDNIEITCYAYKDRVYICDVKEIDKNE